MAYLFINASSVRFFGIVFIEYNLHHSCLNELP